MLTQLQNRVNGFCKMPKNTAGRFHFRTGTKMLPVIDGNAGIIGMSGRLLAAFKKSFSIMCSILCSNLLMHGKMRNDGFTFSECRLTLR